MKSYPFLRHLSSFAGRAVVFFALCSALLFFFFLLGNYQDYLDTTQFFLLTFLRLSLLLQIVCGVLLVPFLIYRCLTEHRLYIARWVLLVIGACLSGGLLILLSYIRLWLPI